MKKLVFATHNQHKTNEVKKLLLEFEILTLADIGCKENISETGSTFAENAQLKSDYVARYFQLDCFADDSGLEVEALNNQPGVFSGRYGGSKNDEANLYFLLHKMKGFSNRKARFKTVVSLKKNNRQYFFEGIINGVLRTAPKGSGGFGYDSIFQPEGYDLTFAEMNMAEKNKISHRAIAIQKLADFLKTD